MGRRSIYKISRFNNLAKKRANVDSIDSMRDAARSSNHDNLNLDENNTFCHLKITILL